MNRFASDVIKDDKVKVRDTDVEAKLDALITAVESSGGGGDLSNVIDDDKLKVKDSDVEAKLDALISQGRHIILKNERDAGNCFNYKTDIRLTTSENPHVAFFNPINSGKTIYIYNMYFVKTDFSLASDGRKARYNIERITGFSGGRSNSEDAVNLKFGSNKTSAVSHRTTTTTNDFDLELTNTTTIQTINIHNDGNSQIYLDYQEEFIELGEGFGIGIEGMTNGTGANVFHQVVIRYIEKDNSSA